MNVFAIVTAAAAYWVLGALWYSALFGGIWSAGLERQGITLKDPTRGQLITKLAGTFAANLVAAFIMAVVLHATHASTIRSGLHVGALAGVGFAATSLAVAYLWESKPLASFAVDASYHIVGCMVCGVILTAWP